MRYAYAMNPGRAGGYSAQQNPDLWNFIHFMGAYSGSMRSFNAVLMNDGGPIRQMIRAFWAAKFLGANSEGNMYFMGPDDVAHRGNIQREVEDYFLNRRLERLGHQEVQGPTEDEFKGIADLRGFVVFVLTAGITLPDWARHQAYRNLPRDPRPGSIGEFLIGRLGRVEVPQLTPAGSFAELGFAGDDQEEEEEDDG